MRLDTLQALLQPALLHGVRDMHVLGAHGPAVGAVERKQDLLQRGLFRADQRAGIENGIEVGLGQVMKIQRQLGDRPGVETLQGVGACMLVTAEAVGIDQLQHPDLPALMGQACTRHTGNAVAAQPARQPAELGPYAGMGEIRPDLAVDRGQGAEIVTPVRRDRIRILQPGFVERLEVGNIAAIQQG